MSVVPEQSLREQIIQLIITLQRKITETTGQTDTNLINRNSLVQANKDFFVKDAPYDKAGVVSAQKKGHLGEVVAGPVYYDASVWWNIDFIEGADGWVKEFTSVERVPSVIVSIDVNQDGVDETRFRLIGTYDREKFNVSATADGNSVITYDGEVLDNQFIYEEITQ